MGIGPELVDVILRELRHRPAQGIVLTLGRQTIGLSPNAANGLFRRYGFDAAGATILDTETLQTRTDGEERISDRSFFAALGFDGVRALDVSAYEGADLIHDLNRPIPSQLEGICDFLIDGSTLDNIFDPSCGLRNIARLLKPGGRCILTNRGNAAEPGVAYTMFNPLWFFDYFVANDFVYCQVCCKVRHDNRWLVYMLSPEAAMRVGGNGRIRTFLTTELLGIIVLAEKGPESTHDRMPTQHAYRSEAEWEKYCKRVSTFASSARGPIMVGDDGPNLPQVPAGWLRVMPGGSLRRSA